jgi:hypothetical protein
MSKDAKAFKSEKQLPFEKFSSEIDWNKWNKGIRTTKKLMKEYSAIEQKQ